MTALKGVRNRLVVFLKATTAENDAGEQEDVEWVEVTRTWAAYDPVSDGERLRAAAVEQKTDGRFRVIWTVSLSQIDGLHRLRFDGSDWQVTGVKEIGFREGLEFTAWRVGRGAT